MVSFQPVVQLLAGTALTISGSLQPNHRGPALRIENFDPEAKSSP